MKNLKLARQNSMKRVKCVIYEQILKNFHKKGELVKKSLEAFSYNKKLSLTLKQINKLIKLFTFALTKWFSSSVAKNYSSDDFCFWSSHTKNREITGRIKIKHLKTFLWFSDLLPDKNRFMFKVRLYYIEYISRFDARTNALKHTSRHYYF